tara:strand:+ start:2349 stop:2984 length:636 start_codon:yes stop_codon:yes gene_type:complete
MGGSVFDNDSLTGVTATSAELNLLDGDTSVGSSITITNTDGFIVNDGGTTKLIPASDVAAYAAASAGDITAVTAGDGLTGGGSSGALTLAVGAGTGIAVAADAISVDVSDFMTNGSDNRIITATGADAMNGEENLQFDGTGLKIKEAANASGDTAAYGQLWVKTATPNELYFTTDAGDDIQITSGTAIAGGGGGGVAADDENLILHMQVFA